MKLTKSLLRRLIKESLNESSDDNMTVGDLIQYLNSIDPETVVVVENKGNVRNLKRSDFRVDEYHEDEETGDEIEEPTLFIMTWS